MQDPFALSSYSNLFHIEASTASESGEVGAVYLLNGHPMVLSSLVDGLPICTLHLIVIQSGGQGLIARDVNDPTGSRPCQTPFKYRNHLTPTLMNISTTIQGFLGIVSKDDQQIALAMTNLTNDVLMFDIGGLILLRDKNPEKSLIFKIMFRRRRKYTGEGA